MSLNYPLLIDTNRQVAEAFESYLVPSTFLIDASGQVISKLVGFKDGEALDRAFADLVS